MREMGEDSSWRQGGTHTKMEKKMGGAHGAHQESWPDQNVININRMNGDEKLKNDVNTLVGMRW